MATSGEIAALVAAATGLGENSVATHVRVLRENHLIATAGRGRGAAQLGLSEAIRVVIGCVVSDEVRRAGTIVADVYALPLRQATVRPMPFPKQPPVSLAFLKGVPVSDMPRRRSFGDDIDVVVSAIGDASGFLMPPEGTGPKLVSRPVAEIWVTTDLIGGAFEVTSAGWMVGQRGIYQITRSYVRKARTNQVEVDDGESGLSPRSTPSVRRRTTIGMPIIRNLTASVPDATGRIVHKDLPTPLDDD